MKYLKLFEVDAYSRIETSKLEELLKKIGFRDAQVRPTNNKDFYIEVKFFMYFSDDKVKYILDRIVNILYLIDVTHQLPFVYFRLRNEDFEDFVKILTSDNILEEIEYQENIRKYNL